jgi:hypothetical protein
MWISSSDLKNKIDETQLKETVYEIIGLLTEPWQDGHFCPSAKLGKLISSNKLICFKKYNPALLDSLLHH